MDRGSTTGRVLLVAALLVIAALLFYLKGSLAHQQRQIARIEEKLDTLLLSRGQAPPAGSAARSAAGARTIERYDEFGKDAIGRPHASRPGYTIYPPLDEEIPGRTFARSPENVPDLCGQYAQLYPSPPDKMNYYLTNTGLTWMMTRYVHESLFTIDLDDPQKLRPELAVAWEVSPDKLDFVFHLRKGVVFSDGTPFDADDVVFTFDMMRDPDVDVQKKRSYFEEVESLTRIDPYTVRVRMRRPYWKALRQVGYKLVIFSKEWFENEIPRRAAERGIDTFSVVPQEPGFAEVVNTFTHVMPAGTGPYLWKDGESWEANEHITLFANPRSWYRAFNPDHHRVERLRWRFILDDVAREQAFLKGDGDVLGVDQEAWYNRYKDDPRIAEVADSYSYDHIALLHSYILFNCREFPFDDRRVRVAIAHLMDRHRLLEEIHRGHGRVATCPTKPTYPEYSHDIEARRYDLERARALLAEAGWRDTDGDGLLDRDGRALEFRFVVPNSLTFYKTVVAMLQESCQKVGVRCIPDPKAWNLLSNDLNSNKFQAVCLYGHASDPWIDLYEDLHSSLAGPGQGNLSGWSNPRADALLDAMREEFDDEKRTKLFHEFNHVFHEDTPLLLLLHNEVRALINKRIRNVQVRKTGLRPRDLWVECD